MEHMELWTIFLSSLLIGLSGAMMPGPLLTITIERSSRYGYRGGWWVVTGHALLEALLVIGMTLGLISLLKETNLVGYISIFGGMLLVWMGGGMIVQSWKNKVQLNLESDPAKTGEGSALRLMLAGVLPTMSNPGWWLWWASIGTSYFLLWGNGQKENISAFYAGHILADYSWYGLVTVGVVAGRKFLKPSLYRGLVFVLGVALVIFAATFFVLGVRSI
jgi:threonine/homoserine/homoserine lactone efflux protein